MIGVQLDFFSELNTLGVTYKINSNYLQARAEKIIEAIECARR